MKRLQPKAFTWPYMSKLKLNKQNRNICTKLSMGQCCICEWIYERSHIWTASCVHNFDDHSCFYCVPLKLVFSGPSGLIPPLRNIGLASKMLAGSRNLWREFYLHEKLRLLRFRLSREHLRNLRANIIHRRTGYHMREITLPYLPSCSLVLHIICSDSRRVSS